MTLLHRAGPEFTRIVEEVQQTTPILDFAGPAGLQQTVWRLPEGPATGTLIDELAGADFYIADGHHRAAAALEEWRLNGKPADSGLLCVVHPMDGLSLSAFHRRVPGPVSPETLVGLLSEEFQLREVLRSPAPSTGSMGLYVDRRWFEVRYLGSRPAGVAGLDVAILQTLVLDRLVRDTSGTDRPLETVPATSPLEELVLRCDVDGGALFTLAPPSADALTAAADADEVMPPKTTFFEPKPPPGSSCVPRALAAGPAVDLLADDVGVAGVPGRLLDHAHDRPPQVALFPFRVTGASGSPSAAITALLAAHASRYSARSRDRDTAASTSMLRLPLPARPPATISSNQSDSTYVRCWSRPARFVPDGTVLRRASSSDSPASFFSTPARSPSRALRSVCSSSTTSQCAG